MAAAKIGEVVSGGGLFLKKYSEVLSLYVNILYSIIIQNFAGIYNVKSLELPPTYPDLVSQLVASLWAIYVGWYCFMFTSHWLMGVEFFISWLAFVSTFIIKICNTFLPLAGLHTKQHTSAVPGWYVRDWSIAIWSVIGWSIMNRSPPPLGVDCHAIWLNGDHCWDLSHTAWFYCLEAWEGQAAALYNTYFSPGT